jgi:hypothetical protein
VLLSALSCPAAIGKQCSQRLTSADMCFKQKDRNCRLYIPRRMYVGIYLYGKRCNIQSDERVTNVVPSVNLNAGLALTAGIELYRRDRARAGSNRVHYQHCARDQKVNTLN